MLVAVEDDCATAVVSTEIDVAQAEFALGAPKIVNAAVN